MIDFKYWAERCRRRFFHSVRPNNAACLPPGRLRYGPRSVFVLAFAMLLTFDLSGTVAADDNMTLEDGQVVADLQTGTLVVRVHGLKNGDGNLRLVLFDSKKNFLERPLHAKVIDIEDLLGTWTIEQLPYGTYAVLAHHDTDASGKMERHWYGKPKEPTGASNDAPANFGPPKFKHAKFQFDSPTMSITVTVR